MLAVKLGSGAPVLESWADHGHIGPQLALVLNDLASVTFVISWLPFAVFVAAAAAALHRVNLLGRPTPVTLACCSVSRAWPSASSARTIPSAPTRSRSCSACCGCWW